VLLKNDELLRKKLLLAMWEGPYFARAVANVISAAVLNRSLALSHN
jgi:hypothetical protein